MLNLVGPARTRQPSNHVTVRLTPEWLTALQQAGVDLMAYDGASASDARGPLAQAAQRIQGDPDIPHPLRPAGEPPAGFDGAELLQWAAEKCAQRPSATFRLQTRDALSTRYPASAPAHPRHQCRQRVNGACAKVASAVPASFRTVDAAGLFMLAIAVLVNRGHLRSLFAAK